MCGFGGQDNTDRVEVGDVFVGGAGSDSVQTMAGGLFIGGAGNDVITAGAGDCISVEAAVPGAVCSAP
jgi:hypothetical protein